jgi:hypothetical protein
MLNPNLRMWSYIVEKLQIDIDGSISDADYYVAC